MLEYGYIYSPTGVPQGYKVCIYSSLLVKSTEPTT